jgi:hypothetical protein
MLGLQACTTTSNSIPPLKLAQVSLPFMKFPKFLSSVLPSSCKTCSNYCYIDAFFYSHSENSLVFTSRCPYSTTNWLLSSCYWNDFSQIGKKILNPLDKIVFMLVNLFSDIWQSLTKCRILELQLRNGLRQLLHLKNSQSNRNDTCLYIT